MKLYQQIPGIAHFELGHPVKGILWMVLVPFLYFIFIVPGILAHAACLADARRIGREQEPCCWLPPAP